MRSGELLRIGLLLAFPFRHLLLEIESNIYISTFQQYSCRFLKYATASFTEIHVLNFSGFTGIRTCPHMS